LGKGGFIMNKYTLLNKKTNNFGDLIADLLDNTTNKEVQMVFSEGEHWQLDIILKGKVKHEEDKKL
jgi:hypothetical protein